MSVKLVFQVFECTTKCLLCINKIARAKLLLNISLTPLIKVSRDRNDIFEIGEFIKIAELYNIAKCIQKKSSGNHNRKL